MTFLDVSPGALFQNSFRKGIFQQTLELQVVVREILLGISNRPWGSHQSTHSIAVCPHATAVVPTPSIKCTFSNKHAPLSDKHSPFRQCIKILGALDM
jgi:hypothetical protein